jgi:hypothetical protein
MNKAIILTASAVRYSDSKSGSLVFFIDACGLGLRFEYDGGYSVLTSDDAQFARDLFSTPSVDVRTVMNEWQDALNAKDVVFEAGAHLDYEGLMSAQLFRSFDDAVDHAEFVSDEWTTPTVYARKVS